MNPKSYVIWGDGNIKVYCARSNSWSLPTEQKLIVHLQTDESNIIYHWERKSPKDVLESIRNSITTQEYETLKRAIR